MPRYKLFATDLDGTVLGHDLRISPRNRAAFKRLEALGVPLVIATGRMFRSTVPFARELDIRLPLVTYQGALIRHHETRLDTWHLTLPRPLAEEALLALEATGLHINVYVDDALYVRAITPEAESYMALASVEAMLVASWDEAIAERGPTKIVAIGTEAEVVHWVAELQRLFGDRLMVTQSQPAYLEIAHPAAGKAAAVAHLARGLGIAPHEIVAVGDGMNDLDMIEMAGLGVAVANAREGLKRAADRVTRAWDEDGVACLIDDLIAEGSL